MGRPVEALEKAPSTGSLTAHALDPYEIGTDALVVDDLAVVFGKLTQVCLLTVPETRAGPSEGG